MLFVAIEQFWEVIHTVRHKSSQLKLGLVVAESHCWDSNTFFFSTFYSNIKYTNVSYFPKFLFGWCDLW